MSDFSAALAGITGAGVSAFCSAFRRSLAPPVLLVLSVVVVVIVAGVVGCEVVVVAVGSEPVSYTHLTLPTICSV